jgi:hypothetical protein
MTPDSDRLIGEIGLAVLALGCLWRLFEWVKQPATSPDPWDKEIEKAIHEPDAVELCHRCFDPVAPNTWFCPKCGSAVGSCNNLMPFVCFFSQGEILRNGINDNLPRSPLIIAGYLLFSLCNYFIFAPIYWVLLFRNLKRKRESVEPTESPHA